MTRVKIFPQGKSRVHRKHGVTCQKTGICRNTSGELQVTHYTEILFKIFRLFAIMFNFPECFDTAIGEIVRLSITGC